MHGNIVYVLNVSIGVLQALSAECKNVLVHFSGRLSIPSELVRLHMHGNPKTRYRMKHRSRSDIGKAIGRQTSSYAKFDILHCLAHCDIIPLNTSERNVSLIISRYEILYVVLSARLQKWPAVRTLGCVEMQYIFHNRIRKWFVHLSLSWELYIR